MVLPRQDAVKVEDPGLIFMKIPGTRWDKPHLDKPITFWSRSYCEELFLLSSTLLLLSFFHAEIKVTDIIT